MHHPPGQQREAAERHQHAEEELQETAPVPSEAFAKALDGASHSPLGGDAPGLVHGPLIPRRAGGPRSPEWLALAIAGLAACSGARPFSTKPVLWEDDDRRPFSPKPEDSFVPLYWDGADHIFFRPFARMWLLPTGHPARERERARRGARLELVHQPPRPAPDDDGGDRPRAVHRRLPR